MIRDLLIVSGGTITGTISVPGDKSISHRAALFAALANGPGDITGFLESADTDALLAALAALGIRIERTPETVRIHGRGAARWDDPEGDLDLGNSGTALRLLAGVLAGRGVRATLTGDASLRTRPMQRIVEPLQRMGAVISAREGTPPVVLGGGALRGVTHPVPATSAQVVSCLLLAGLHADGETWVARAPGVRDHTERMLAHFDIPLQRDNGRLGVTGCEWDAVAARPIAVPRDPSAAAFFAVAAALVPGAEVTLPGLCANPTRTGFAAVLGRMGAEVGWAGIDDAGAEPVGTLHVHGRALQGVRISAAEVPTLIDELPALMVAAAYAKGRTVVAGAAELRHKESDRIATMAAMLSALGVEVRETPDGVEIEGGRLRGGTVDARHDHRVAMAAAVAALGADGPVTIRNCAEIATSFPGFAATARAAGMEVAEG
ncbi:MAG: 3-phosphoshikimate 1-carboxyvinyltransferase [Xanthomonadaceae bacterium]|nr:3-phosphoshikimate 1-carboxyvinyltransferase [Xanthomonadaceae bacterium]